MESIPCEVHSNPPDLGPDYLAVPGLTRIKSRRVSIASRDKGEIE
jgi:hypothetical protein